MLIHLAEVRYSLVGQSTIVGVKIHRKMTTQIWSTSLD